MLNESLYKTNPVVLLYDNDNDLGDGTDGLGGTATVTDPDGGDGNSTPPPPKDNPNARFNNDQVNKIVQDRLAKDRKKHEEKYRELEKSYQEILASQTLSEAERTKLEQAQEDLRKQFRTKEEQAKFDKKQMQEQYEKDLIEYKDKAGYWETQFRTSTINKSLMDAAVKHDAFIPRQIVTILREYTKLVNPVDENGKAITSELVPMVDLPDVEEDTGKPTITQRTPDSAVERLKVLEPNLFKANVVSGVGGNSATGGLSPGADGKVDARKLSTAQFIKILKEDPSKLGLRDRPLH